MCFFFQRCWRARCLCISSGTRRACSSATPSRLRPRSSSSAGTSPRLRARAAPPLRLPRAKPGCRLTCALSAPRRTCHASKRPPWLAGIGSAMPAGKGSSL
eukprot:Amastigsp_a177846_15.p6 type:complete len:101 gc:universal Amastigsp_a177846_15:466-768(+)